MEIDSGLDRDGYGYIACHEGEGDLGEFANLLVLILFGEFCLTGDTKRHLGSY